MAAAAAEPAGEADRQLMTSIKRCTDWRQLAALLTQRPSEHLNHLHAAALLTHLAQTRSRVAAGAAGAAAATHAGPNPQPFPAPASPRRQPAKAPAQPRENDQDADNTAAKLLQAVCSMVEAHVGSLGARQVANCLWALSKLPPALRAGAGAGARLLPALLRRADGLWPDYNGQELCNLAAALAALHAKPHLPAGWGGAFAAALAPHVPSLKPQEVANALLALAQLQQQGCVVALPPALVPSLLQRFRAVLASCSAQDAALFLLAASRLQAASTASAAEMTAGWLDGAFFDATRRLLGGMNCQDAAHVLHALGRLGVRPPLPWLEALLRRCEPRLARFQPQELCASLHGLALLGIAPSEDWMASFWAAVEPRLPSVGARELVGILWAAGRLGQRPGDRLLLSLEDAARRALPAAPLQAASMTLTAFALLGHTPQPRFIDAMLQRLLEAAARCPPSEAGRPLADAAYALALLGFVPRPALAASFLAAARAALPALALQPQALSTLVWSLAKLGIHPDEHAAEVTLVSAGAAGAGSGYREGSAAPSPVGAAAPLTAGRPNAAGSAGWLPAFCSALVAALPACSAQGLAMSLRSLAKFGYLPTPSVLQSLLRRAGELADGGSMGAQAVANCLWALQAMRVAAVRRACGPDAGGSAGGPLPAAVTHARQVAAALSPSDADFAAAASALLAAFERAASQSEAAPAGVAAVLLAVVRLGLPLPPRLLPAIVARRLPTPERCGGQELAGIAWALVRLKAPPPRRWLRRLAARAALLRARGDLTARDKAVLGGALPRLMALAAERAGGSLDVRAAGGGALEFPAMPAAVRSSSNAAAARPRPRPTAGTVINI